MPRFVPSAHARVPRSAMALVAATVVSLLAASTAVALRSPDASLKSTEVVLSTPVSAHDSLGSQQALAAAFDAHLAAQREAARVVVTVPPPPPKARASRSAPRPRPTPAPKPPPPPVASPMTGDIVWPAAGELTGHYGEQRGRSRHPGIDIDGETGDPVWAATTGVVSWAGPSPSGYSGYGTMVLIDHGNGLQTLYAHLSSVTVAAGQAVKPGLQVGRIGTTGNVTGSHLHFEVRRNGASTDPLAWLPPR